MTSDRRTRWNDGCSEEDVRRAVSMRPGGINYVPPSHGSAGLGGLGLLLFIVGAGMLVFFLGLGLGYAAFRALFG